MIATLAFRNLVHDRARFALTLIAISISIMLVGAQMGLMLGFGRMISGVLDHAKVDLWIVPVGTTAFDDPALIDISERYSALAIAGVESISPLIVGFAEWRRAEGGSVSVIVLGSDTNSEALRPWSIVSGAPTQLREAEAVSIDQAYALDLGISTIGDLATIEGKPARVGAITTGIRSFTTSPYVFTSLEQARAYLSVPAAKTTYLAVKLSRGVDIQAVQSRIAARLKRAEVLTTAEFRARNVDRWMFSTGAGALLLSGIVLALSIGSFIVAQTLYASINEHLKEFATLRALGSSKGFLRSVIFCQAGLSAIFSAGMAAIGIAMLIFATAGSALPIILTPAIAELLLALSLGMSIVAAALTVTKVSRVQPAAVFSR